jgi:O-antigen ligase
LAVGVGAALWRGGFFQPAQVMVAVAVGVAAITLRPGLRWRDPIWIGLAVTAVADVVALAIDGGTPGAVCAAAALPLAYLLAGGLPRDRDPVLLWTIVAVALTTAVSGLVGFLLHLSPYAESIGGVWRAAGAMEYPPALAVLSAAGLACALALYVRGALRTDTAAVAVVLLVAGALASYDRAGLVLLVLTASVFGWRHPQTRMLLGAVAVTTAAAAVALLLASHPDASTLHSSLFHDPFASRTNVWADAARGAARSPFTGYGPGQFPRVYAGLAHPPLVTLAHDQVLEQAADAGLLAAAGAVLVLLAGFGRCLAGIGDPDPTRLAFALAAGVVLLSSLYDFTWSFVPLAVLATVAMARLSGRRSSLRPESR